MTCFWSLQLGKFSVEWWVTRQLEVLTCERTAGSLVSLLSLRPRPSLAQQLLRCCSHCVSVCTYDFFFNKQNHTASALFIWLLSLAAVSTSMWQCVPVLAATECSPVCRPHSVCFCPPAEGLQTVPSFRPLEIKQR